LRDKSSQIYYSQKNPPLHNDKSTYNNRIKTFGKFKFSREVSCHSVEKWTIQKLMGFTLSTSNAPYAMEIDASIKQDIDEFFNLAKTKCGSEFEIIFPYAMVIAVK